MQTVSRTLVDTLVAHGIRHVFAVPGESYLAVLDALYDVQDQLALVTCRHEAAAANMAEAAGKLTGRPGVAMVTRGPGATQASIGVHTAFQDSTPMLLFVGQVGTDMLQREAFQEIDYRQMFAGVAKRVVVIDRADRTAELVASACASALSGRPGPVVVVLPEDLLSDAAPAALPAPVPITPPAPDADAMARLGDLLSAASRPVLWIGGPGWTDAAVDDIQHFAEDARLPVVTSWRRKDRFDNAHPKYAGELGLGANPALVARMQSADLVIALGTRLGEVTSLGYTLPAAGQALVHIHPDGDALGKVFGPVLAIQSGIASAAAGLAAMGHMIVHEDRDGWAEAARADYDAWVRPTSVQSGVNMADVIAHIGSVVGPDAIFTNGAGNFAAWLHRFHQHRRLGTQLAPTSGAMGYGVPAGIAAKILHPAREVITIAGDGDFLMSGQELATAARYGANVIIIVVDNAQYGTIRMHQARDFPGRQSGTALTNPDFAAYAQSFGAFGATVECTEDFPAAFAAARASGKPALICVKTDPDEISPGRRIS